MLIPLPWLAEYVPLHGRDGEGVAAALVSVGLEEEAVHGSGVAGPLVAGMVLEVTPELQKNGKTINWCQVDVGPDNGGVRGIVCGAHNFAAGDKVAVALPGAVLPGPFPISSRKTYGHVSDGMICSASELGLGGDQSGIIVLSRMDLNPEPGTDLIPPLGLDEETVEVNVTPDRGYCFSIRGVAREFSHATDARFTDPAMIVTPPATDGGFEIELEDSAPIHGVAGCDRFVARVVRGCDAFGPAPEWMRRRLTQAGMRPISLAVDVTNYVMLELGQPLHAYDLHAVTGPIVVRRARLGERLVTLDGADRVLDPEDLLITDSPGGQRASRVLGLAGVMGGASSEVGSGTRDLLIEAAHFDPVTVARTSRRHKLSSEAAKRFERGADPELPPKAVQRVIDLLIEYGGGAADLAVTDSGQAVRAPGIAFDPDYPSRLVGVEYSHQQIQQILEEIGCLVERNDATATGQPVARQPVAPAPGAAAGAGTWLVTPPSWRPDLTRAVDLVEEVARIDGYDHIPSRLAGSPPGGGLTKSQRSRRSVARSLSDFGLTEVLSYPFVGEATFDALGYGAGDPRRLAVRLANPLDAAAPALRTSILQTLLGTARRNAARGLTDASLFELGLVTLAPAEPRQAAILGVDSKPSNEQLAALEAAVPAQPRHVAGVLMGYRVRPGVWGPGRRSDWADAVEAAKVAARTVNVHAVASQDQRAPFHPGRCARLSAGQVTLGWAGELHPAVVRAFGLPEAAAAFEIDLDVLTEVAPDMVAALPVSPRPLAKEDLAFVVDRSLPVGELVTAVGQGAGPAAEDVFVFDVYEGDQIPADKKSVAIALRLRAGDHTLTPQEIAQARAGAIAEAAGLGAELRA
ncbi:MAG: phenylalanine--tRNA ligase subunit beta [Bifidobacteriaceae bacterium]|jgi:phenylalanyl-tRNA synthetase beta chain|nr:phenylalanine--tRNA ligase subunit beta [Bifidobacteriaceae bacterium]